MPDDFSTALAKSKAPKAPPAFGEALAMARGGGASLRATPDEAASARAVIFGSADPDSQPAPDEVVNAVLDLQGHGQRVEAEIAKYSKELDREAFPGIFKAAPSDQALEFERMGGAEGYRKAERALAIERMGGVPTLGKARRMLSVADSEARAAEDQAKIRQSENPILRYGARFAVDFKERAENAGAWVRENLVRPIYPPAYEAMRGTADKYGMSEEGKAIVREDTKGLLGDVVGMAGQTAAFIPEVALGGTLGAAAVSSAASGGDVMAGVETAAFLKTAGALTKLFGGASESVVRQVLAEGGGLTLGGLATRLGFHGDPGTAQQAVVDAMSGLAFGVMGGGARARESAAKFKAALEGGKTLEAAAAESGIPAERLKVPPVPEAAWMREAKFETAKDVMPTETPIAPRLPEAGRPLPVPEKPILEVPDAPNLKRGKSGTKVMAEEYARAAAKAPVDEAIRRFEERTGIRVGQEPTVAEKPVSVAPVAPIEAQAKPPAPDAPASKTLVGTDKRVVTADDLPDARGSAETKWYHGTGAKDLNPQVLDTIGSSDPNSLVGMGLYLTDSPQIAETYAAARGRRTGTPTVYEAQVAPRNVINFEKPLPPQVAETMARAAGGLSETAGQYVKDAIANGKSGMEVYKAMREGLIYDEIPLSEATETLQTLQGQLRDLGYDAISHIGGLRAGKGENLHRVLVVLDPNYGYSREGKFVQPYENPVRSFAPKAFAHPQEVAEAKASAQGAAIEPKAEAPKPVEPDPWTLTPEQFKARYGGDASDWAAVVRNGIEIFNATNIPPEVRRTYDEQTAARNAKSKAAKDAYDASQRDEYLYHVAPASRAGRIESEGLRPNAGATVRGGSYEGYSKGKVFLTEKGGIDFWKDRVSRHLEDQGLPSDVTVYRVKRSDVPDAKPDAIGSKDATKPAYYADRPIRVEPVATAEASKPPAPEARPMEAAPAATEAAEAPEARMARIRNTPPGQRSSADVEWANAYLREKAKATQPSTIEAKKYTDFLEGLPTLARAKARDALNRSVMRDGRPQTRADLVERLVGDGYEVRVAANGERRLTGPDGGYVSESQISKTAMDYADSLVRARAAAPAEAPVPRPGKQSEAPPKPADVVRELTAPTAETSMFAGGPESISTKAYEAWTATREGFRGAIKGLKDFFSSQKAPELLRLSPRAWRGVVAAESAPQIAKAAVKVWEAEVPNPSWSPKERVQFEAALTENNRLGAVDNRIADAEAKRTEAQALREQAATLNGSAAADALLKKATRLDREALVFDERAKRAEGKNEYLIGEGKPFASQAELAEFVSRPDVVEAAKRHQAWWSEMVEPSYKSAQSIEGTEAMPTRGRFFDSRASLVVPPEGEATTGVAGSKAGQTENIKTRRSKFAHLAWGDSSRGYEVEANKYLKKALEDVVPKGGWRDAVDSLVREGHGVRLTKPDQQKPTEIAGEPAVKFDIGQQGERVYLPKSLHETLTHIRQVGAATHIKGFSDLAKTATHQAMSMAKDNIFVMARAISRVMTLPSTGRPALEIAGNVALWPVMRVIDIANLGARALGYMKASPRERLAMGTAGVAEREPMLKRDSKGRVETDAQGNPIEIDANLPGLKWLGPVSNAIDTAARESLVTTMRRLKANGVNIDTSPEAMSKYVGQLGRYGRAWYGAIQRIFTDSGANPFFESRRTSRGNALRMMAANPNLTPLDTGTALKLRGVVLSKLVGLMTTTAIANVLTTGDVLGGPSTPVGAISLGKDKDGKRIFLDFWKLMGIRQVARATGIEQALEGLRRGDDAGQVALSALTGAGREAAGFASGPLPTALSIGATGSRPDQLIGGQTDASIPAAVDPATLTRRRAVEGAKAALPLVGEGAELFAKWFGGENIKDILNAGTEVTPDMIDEFVNLRNTVGVGVGQTDAQASTLHDRSNKGFFFGTYLDAVKEDLRRASPDKVQAIVDKAWRDIDTRDDLSAGDKKKAKSAIQYYARNRRLLMGGR